MQPWQPCTKAILITVVSTYPFAAVLRWPSTLRKDDFRTCEETAGVSSGCIFMRYTNMFGIPGTDGGFASVVNGEDEIHRFSLAQLKDLLSHPPFIESAFEQRLRHWCFNILRPFGEDEVGIIEPKPCLGMNRDTMQETCHKDYVQAGLNKNLLLRRSQCYMFTLAGILGWAFFKIIHDIAVLNNCLPLTTFSWGFLSVVSQGFAACCSFWWALSGTEVFVSKVPLVDSDCYCFYRVPYFEALLIMAMPGTLLLVFLLKLRQFSFAMVYGDYVHAFKYYIPQHSLEKSSVNWSQGDLVVLDQKGEEDGTVKKQELPKQSLLIGGNDWCLKDLCLKQDCIAYAWCAYVLLVNLAAVFLVIVPCLPCIVALAWRVVKEWQAGEIATSWEYNSVVRFGPVVFWILLCVLMLYQMKFTVCNLWKHWCAKKCSPNSHLWQFLYLVFDFFMLVVSGLFFATLWNQLVDFFGWHSPVNAAQWETDLMNATLLSASATWAAIALYFFACRRLLTEPVQLILAVIGWGHMRRRTRLKRFVKKYKHHEAVLGAMLREADPDYKFDDPLGDSTDSNESDGESPNKSPKRSSWKRRIEDYRAMLSQREAEVRRTESDWPE